MGARIASKRVFLSLLGVSALGLGVLAALIGYALWGDPGGGAARYLGIAALLIVLSVAVLMLVGVVGLLLNFSTARGKLDKITAWSIRAVFPLARALGKLVGLEREQIDGSFLQVNNNLVAARTLTASPDSVLVLVPHCLQWNQCRRRVSVDLEECRRCGKCKISDLIEFQRETGIRVRVATGGGQARRMVAETKPDLIVAVACERELASGIQDVHSIPVVAVPNIRPEGYCKNTQVDLSALRESINQFVHAGKVRGDDNGSVR